MVLSRPILVFLVSFVVFWAAARMGARYLRRTLEAGERESFGFVLGAVLTLLGLLIGFSFSMAIGRYDQRKNFEEEEANAIGTEYLRAELLAPADAAKIRGLLESYLEQRVAFYQTRDPRRLRQVNGETGQLQAQMWSTVRSAALSQPSPVTALAVSGMNDVLNSQGYTQAAWWNRIPVAAWWLMGAIAICCNLLVGFGTSEVGGKATSILLYILPLVLAISFLLLSDLDTPRGGLVHVRPDNLLSLSGSLHR